MCGIPRSRRAQHWHLRYKELPHIKNRLWLDRVNESTTHITHIMGTSTRQPNQSSLPHFPSLTCQGNYLAQLPMQDRSIDRQGLRCSSHLEEFNIRMTRCMRSRYLLQDLHGPS